MPTWTYTIDGQIMTEDGKIVFTITLYADGVRYDSFEEPVDAMSLDGADTDQIKAALDPIVVKIATSLQGIAVQEQLAETVQGTVQAAIASMPPDPIAITI